MPTNKYRKYDQDHFAAIIEKSDSGNNYNEWYKTSKHLMREKKSYRILEQNNFTEEKPDKHRLDDVG